MITTIIFFGMMAVVSYFALVPLKAAAEYRFRGKFSLTAEGIGFLACAVLALLSGIASLTGFLLLGAGIVAGTGIRSIKGNDRRYLE